MNAAEKRLNMALVKRIEKRIAEGWSLEMIGQRTVWLMYGHVYQVRDGVLTVRMAGGERTFASKAVAA